jgi:resuscitation-promoting factor RpfB
MKSLKWWQIALIAGVIVLLLGGLSLRKTVEIDVDGDVQSVTTWSLKVAGALEQAGVVLRPGDVVTPESGTRLKNGEIIAVQRAVQVQIHTGEDLVSLYTTARVIRDVLAAADLSLSSDERVFITGRTYTPNQPLPHGNFLTLFIRPTVEISVDEDGSKRKIDSAAPTLGAALWEHGIEVLAADEISKPLNTPLKDDISVRIEHAQPLEIVVGGQNVAVLSTADTVGEALAEAGVPLLGLDYSVPAESKTLPEDGIIHIVQVREDVIIEQEPLAFDVQSQPLPEVDLDTQQLVQAGEYGLKAERVRVRYEDGEEVSRQVEAEWVAREPVPRIEGYGSKVTIQTIDTPNGPIEYYRAMEFYATSYSPARAGVDPSVSWYGHVACGGLLQTGYVGVDLDYIPCGTLLYIPGYGIATAMDTGNINGRWIDLGFTDEEYQQWNQYVTVYFLTPVPENVPLYIPPGTFW